MIPALLALYLSVIGLVLGSFLGLVSVRLPRNEDVVRGRSHCRTCRRTLSWLDLVPVASYVLTRGRCRFCSAAISFKYLLIELAAGAIGVCAALAGSTLVEVMLTALLGWQLLLIAVIDLEHYWLPDHLTLLLLTTGIFAAIVGHPVLTDSLLGAVAGFGLLWSLALAYRQFRGREGLGSGDPILFAAIGAWVGWQNLSAVLLGACMAGLSLVAAATLVRKHFSSTTRIPFAPLLAIAAFAVWIWQL